MVTYMKIINSMENVDDIIWHDGVLVETRMECYHTEYNFILTAEVYVDDFTSARGTKNARVYGSGTFITRL